MNDNVVRLSAHRAPHEEPPAVVKQPPAQTIAMAAFASAGAEGMTWKEVASITGASHGSTSGLLTRLHKKGTLERLSIRRDGCRVYVLPEHVEDRKTETTQPNADQILMADMAAALRRVPTKCKHRYWTANCRSCEIKAVLYRYEVFSAKGSI